MPRWWQSAWWPRHTARNGCPAAISSASGGRRAAMFGGAVARPGPDDHQVEAVEPPRRIVLMAYDGAADAEHAEDVPQHVHEVVLGVEHHGALPGQPGVRR